VSGTLLDVASKESRRDRAAAALLQQLRTDSGLSPETLSQGIHAAKLGYVSGRQIRRIEREGIIPTARVQFAIAQFFERVPSEVWVPRSNYRVAA
jgi:DNA-binding XRE family transcriptional regulator